MNSAPSLPLFTSQNLSQPLPPQDINVKSLPCVLVFKNLSRVTANPKSFLVKLEKLSRIKMNFNLEF